MYDYTRNPVFGLGERIKENIKEWWLGVLIVGIILALIGNFIWFHMNYVCASSHVETQQRCDTTCWNSGNSGMSNCSTSCYPREVEICDQYIPRE